MSKNKIVGTQIQEYPADPLLKLASKFLAWGAAGN